MPEVSSIGNGPHGTANRTATAALKGDARFDTDVRSVPSDRVELSEQAQRLDEPAPELRGKRLEAVKAAIESGTYETEDRLNVAIERLIEELKG